MSFKPCVTGAHDKMSPGIAWDNCIILLYSNVTCSIFYFLPAKSTFEKLKMLLEEEKAAHEKHVRELTYKLQMGADDLSKKEVGRQTILSNAEESMVYQILHCDVYGIVSVLMY